MIFGSVCSGIEAVSVAWEPLGYTCAFLSEIAPFPCSVLRHHYPEVTLHEDFTKISEASGPIDVLVGGTPCQSFSTSGLRRGLADPRGNLALEFLALAQRVQARWILWENVAGVLSSEDGKAFGVFTGLLGECGYGWAYRVLDAQFFGVPQSRRRLFVVGHRGDWRPPAAVLFEPEGVSGTCGQDFALGKNGRNSPCDFPKTARCLLASGYTMTPKDNYWPHGESGVRKMTPLEWERLQGFPDGYTDVPYRGQPASDTRRYHALGNSMAVPVLRWLGQRILAVEAVCAG